MKKVNTLYEEKIYSINSIFKKKAVLGFGINGKVILVKSKKDKKLYAMKTLDKNSKAKDEITLHWDCLGSCANIVDIQALYSSDKKFYLILEYMQGGSLWDKLKHCEKNFSEKDIVKIMRQICTAVAVIHSKGIAHRDIKLENILCSSESSDFTVKLADFGFARREKLGLNSTKFTAPYVAPEVLSEFSYSISCDIWSLGVVMFILCCGNLPFSSSTNSDFTEGMRQRIKSRELDLTTKEWSALTNEAKDLILNMIVVDPNKRLSIDQILNHSWFNKQASETPLNSKKFLQNIDLSNFKFELEEQFEHMRNLHLENSYNFNLKDNELYQKRMTRLSPISEQNEDQISIYDNLSQSWI